MPQSNKLARKMFGEKLRKRREARGLTQDQLAKKVGTTRVSINKWENGVSTPLPIYRERLNRMFGKII